MSTKANGATRLSAGGCRRALALLAAGTRRAAYLFCGTVLLAGLAPRAEAVSATGGTVTNYTLNGTKYQAHVFTTAGTTSLAVSVGGNVEVLVVGGGGGGGAGPSYYGGGGGGAGGVIVSNLTVSAGSISITVGSLGAGGTTAGDNAGDGGYSSFGTLKDGGGGGGPYTNAGHAGTSPSGATVGGCGGGAGRDKTGGGGVAGTPAGDGIAFFVTAGGGGGGGSWGSGGGGGGAVQAGYAGGNDQVAHSDTAAQGGAGITNAFSGVTNCYAGGGGGAWETGGGTAVLGGSGVGGSGAMGGTQSGGPAAVNTGSGGGGGRSGGGGNGASGIVIVRYLDLGDLAIQNQPVADVATGSATFNGLLTSTGGSACAVCVLWGEQNGGATWNWAKTNWFNGGAPNPAWTNNTPFSTNLTTADGLQANKTYYYTYAASNDTVSAVAPLPVSLITGEVTVDLTDGTAQFKVPPDTGTFTIRRPATCTNEDLTVSYTMSGTATNPTHYTLDYPNSVTMTAGSTSAVVMLTPTLAGVGTAILTLTASNTYNYPVGTPSSATVTIQPWVPARMSAVGGTITNYSIGRTNFTAHIFTNAPNTNITFSTMGVVDVLIVAGGGGGANGWASNTEGGGGGAGGLIYLSNIVVTQGLYLVKVGGGGLAGNNGTNSSFGTNSAIGGGRGGAPTPGSGGSGGGGGYNTDGADGTSGQGNKGGKGGTAGTAYGVGGGGGAGHQGYDGTGSKGGDGGEGLAYSISGVTSYYAGGGGGGAESSATGPGLGGSGVGGNGGVGSDGSNAVENTGSGGGGGYASGNGAGGKGSSGIVIVRYGYYIPPPAGTVFLFR